MSEPRYTEERSRVMLGTLPDDFLRVLPSEEESEENDTSHTAGVMLPTRRPNPADTRQITLCIVQAQLAKSYSMVGRMDLYVRLRIGHSILETQSAARGGKNPHWNKTVTSYLPNGIKTVHIELYDERTLTPDERIAYTEYVIPDEVMNGKFIDTWIPLSGKQGVEKEGSINITVSVRMVPYWSMAQPQAAPVMVLPQHMGMYPYYMPGQPVAVPYQMGVQPMQNPNYGYPPIQQPYRPTDEDIKQMQEMFPDFDKDVITGVLENCQGNKEQAATALLTLSDK